MDKAQAITRIREIVTKPIHDMGYEIADIVFEREEAYEGREILVVYIEKEGGVGMQDCVMVHKAINPLIDASDPIKHSYVLSVSSKSTDTENP